ncbi:MAG: winged helix-turn-helix transcriptional regulator [Hyphomicrobiaceae bacterium]
MKTKVGKAGRMVAANETGQVGKVDGLVLNELLDTVSRQAHVSQRKLASELGVALGLINLYIKRCVKKGWIKVEQVPPGRFAYYLTPTGFSEKSRLAGEYLSWSLTFFRRARHDCAEVMREATGRGWRSIGLVGGGELAYIGLLAAAEEGLQVAAIVDSERAGQKVMRTPVVARSEEVVPQPDGWIVTGVENGQSVCDLIVGDVGAERVLAPALTSLRIATEVAT